MLHPAANRHPKATHQWLLMGVQACRLPAPKSLKPLKRLKALKTLKTVQTVQKLLGTPNRAGNSAAPRPHRLNILLACFVLQPTGTPRPHINGFLLACTLTTVQKLLGTSNRAGNSCAKGTSIASSGRSSLPFAPSKAHVTNPPIKEGSAAPGR